MTESSWCMIVALVGAGGRGRHRTEEGGGNQKWEQPLGKKLCPAGQNWSVLKWDAVTIDLEAPVLKKQYQAVNFLVQIPFSVEQCSKIRTSPGYQCYILVFADTSTTVDTVLYLNFKILFSWHFPWDFTKKIFLLFQDENASTFTL